MIKVQKNKDGFLITSSQGALWAIEEIEEAADCITYANEKKAKKSKIKTFDWPGEYEKKGIEISGIETGDDGLVTYLGKIDGKKILSVNGDFTGFNPEKFNKIDDEIDIFIINILEDTDKNILLKIIEQSGAKIVIFSGNIDKVKEDFQNIQTEIELKITSIPEEKTEYYQL